MTWKSRGDLLPKSVMSQKWMIFLCVGSFCAGMFFTNRMWTIPEPKGLARTTAMEAEKLNVVSEGCNSRILQEKEVKRETKGIYSEVFKTQNAIQTLDKTISNLEMELAAAKAAQESIRSGAPVAEDIKMSESSGRRRYLMVVGINTAFSSRKRRDSVRETWMPQGEKRKKLEEEKGIIIRFVIGHSATSGGILDRAIEAEDRKHGDFLRLDHVEGYLELSAKTKTYFATAVNLWDADFYIKVDDDVHVNIATLGQTLLRHRSKPRVYIGCMKSGPVLSQKGVRYHEPEYWKFGEAGNKYFRHATGQLYAISKDLATYISNNKHVLHKYANEDVSLGSWFIGLDVDHIDDRRLCCGTPPGEGFSCI
uniref:Hexosyltransferase n=1 Tax=Glycine max TaxID=3847 RepID=K7LVW2_SOYBN